MTAISTDRAPRDGLAYWFSAGHLCIDWPFGATYVIAPAVAASLGWSATQLGLLLTIQSFVAALAYAPAGMLMDRTRARARWLALTFFWVSAGYLLASMAEGFWLLALLLAAASIGDAAWHPMATGILVKAAPDRRAKVLGIHAIGGAMAVVLAPLAAGALLKIVDWRMAMQVILLLPLGMGILFLIVLPSRVPRVDLSDSAHVDLKALLRDWVTPVGLLLAGMMVLYNFGLIGATAMMTKFLIDAQGFGILEASVAFSGVLLIGAVVQPWTGQLSDRIGRRPVIAAGAWLAALGGVTVYFADGTVPVIAGLALCFGALTGVRSVVLSCAVDLSGRGEATTLGIAFAVLDGIGALGAVTAGALGETDLSRAFLMAAFCSFAAGGMALLLPGRLRGGTA